MSEMPEIGKISPEICDRSAQCVTRDIWGEVKAAMDGVLEATTLQDLVDRQKKKNLSTPSSTRSGGLSTAL